ncbi:hypothetical protein [Paraburkholderia unamae]|uniref:Uncharacterized protein n=1 Tax=Paraburkholderia unamae TaxID=219649 RepID=A0ACC6RVP6_9BURK
MQNLHMHKILELVKRMRCESADFIVGRSGNADCNKPDIEQQPILSVTTREKLAQTGRVHIDAYDSQSAGDKRTAMTKRQPLSSTRL